jgi:hypothetical protein
MTFKNGIELFKRKHRMRKMSISSVMSWSSKIALTIYHLIYSIDSSIEFTYGNIWTMVIARS